MPDGGEPDAAQRAEATACGHAALAVMLAGLSEGIALERAIMLAQYHLDAARIVVRSRGGQGRGKAQTQSAERFWRPWVDLYQMHRNSGLNERKARAATVASMEQADVKLPDTGEFPGGSVIRARLAG